MRLRADLTLLLVAVLWGSAFAAQRAAAQLGSVYLFNGARFLLAALLLAPFAFRKKPAPRQWVWMCVAGTVLFIASAFQQVGLLTTGAGNAGFLTSLYVVVVPLVMWIGWKEKPRAVAVAAVILAGLGAFLLSTAGRYQATPGDAWELAGAAFWAVHVVVLGKYAATYDAISFSAGQLAVGSALNLLASSWIERPNLALPGPLAFAILYTAVVSLGLGYTLQIWGQKRTPPTDAAILLSLESVFAVVAGALVFREVLAPLQIAGCALILGAVVLSQARAWGRIQSGVESDARN